MKAIIKPPYSYNKLFQSSNTISVDESLVERFNSFYTDVRANKKKDKRIIQVLNLIFESLRFNSNDSQMNMFIDELQRCCNIVLQNDLKIQELNYKYKNKNFKNFNEEVYEGLSESNCYVVKINDNTIDKILKLSDNHLKKFNKKRKLLQNSREDLSIDSGYVPREICRILNKEFNKKGILTAISKYMGFPVKVGGCSLELSVCEATWHNVNYYEGSNSKTKYFHHDESIVDPKAIVYLSDVKEKNGPVSYLDESNVDLKINGIQHIVGKAILEVGRDPRSRIFHYYKLEGKRPFENIELRKHFSMLPDIIKHNSHFGWDIEIDSKHEKNILENEKKVIGERGTCLLFDGSRLLHRGGIVDADDRIALQVVFNYSKDLLIHKKVFSKIKSLLNIN